MKWMIAVLAVFALLTTGGASVRARPGEPPHRRDAATDDLIFIHHSCGQNWLNDGLHDALLAKDYIDERNDITYGTDIPPDNGRPDSLAPTPGDKTDMNHWILWFNDYLNGVKAHGAEDGYNRIIMFKSCFPNSNITSDGAEPGDPFSSSKTLANYKAQATKIEMRGYTPKYSAQELAGIEVSQRRTITPKNFSNFLSTAPFLCEPRTNPSGSNTKLI